MKLTTLCYIEKDGMYLMLHRTKKANDENGGKYVGVGGRFEEFESPEECIKREITEETGLQVKELVLRGIITFVSDPYYEYMFLFTCKDYFGELIECDEGDLEWVDKKEVPLLNLWEGDRIFLKLLEEREEFFSLKLVYTGEKLSSALLDGKSLII